MWICRVGMSLVAVLVAMACSEPVSTSTFVPDVEAADIDTADVPADVGSVFDAGSDIQAKTDIAVDVGSGEPDAGPSEPDASEPDIGEPPASGPLLERLQVTAIEVAAGVKPGVKNWRIWGKNSLVVAPVFTTPTPGCGVFVGFTTGNGAEMVAQVLHLDAEDAQTATLDLATGFELRGLAAESETRFGALLWDAAEARIFVRRFDISAGQLSDTELVNAKNIPDDFEIGDSRLEYGEGKYGAYYHVHSDTGHEGDTLKWVDASSGDETTGWAWGCSHSMSNLLRFNSLVANWLPACVTDCYPGTSGSFPENSIGGIYLNHKSAKIIDVAAECNGSVAGELGGAALSPDGWVVVFNAHRAPAKKGHDSYDSTMNQDIGFATVKSLKFATGPVVWLTDTPGNEDDATIARWQPLDDDSEQYLVGWHDNGTYLLARMAPTGQLLEGPVDVSAKARWGRRDDPFRAHQNRDISWAWFDGPKETTLHVARVKSGRSGCQ